MRFYVDALDQRMTAGRFLFLWHSIDAQILDFMKKRDATNDFNEKQRHIRAAMELMAAHNGEYSVDFSKPYDYYVVNEDVTQRLNNLMEATVEKYKGQVGSSASLLNLPLLYGIVRNGAELDLKNQEEWKKSGYIYDGELVDLDALGNIAYGYFGASMGLDDAVLLAGAGLAQAAAGTSLPEFGLTFGDDPRDQYRIMQGIEIYRILHQANEG